MPTIRADLQAFWPYYVRQHTKLLNRQLHFVGNTNLFFWLAWALIKRSPKLVVWAVVSSYALAWIGHFGVEHNIPATFRYPVKAGLCDMLMYVKMWQGTMDAEVRRYTSGEQV